MALRSSSILHLLAISSFIASSCYAACVSSGRLHAHAVHRGRSCAECCKEGKTYPQFNCSPPVSKETRAILTVNNFEKGGDGGGTAECDNKFHKNTERVVALSTGWYAKGSRCGKSVVISANGRQVSAKVVDECDSVKGCDAGHKFQPPCRNNVVDASPAVWKALGIDKHDRQFGFMKITWTME